MQMAKRAHGSAQGDGGQEDGSPPVDRGGGRRGVFESPLTDVPNGDFTLQDEYPKAY